MLELTRIAPLSVEHSGQTPLPLLRLAVHQTTAVWKAVGDNRIHFPAAANPKEAKTAPKVGLCLLRLQETCSLDPHD